MFDIRFICSEVFWLMLIFGLSVSFWNFLDVFWAKLVNSRSVTGFHLFGGDSLYVFMILNLLATLAFVEIRWYLLAIYLIVDLTCIIAPRYFIYQQLKKLGIPTPVEFSDAMEQIAAMRESIRKVSNH